MRRQLPVLIAALGLALVPPPARAYEVEVVQERGDPANRIDLLVLGDGYREQDQDQLSSDVAAFLAEFWAETPYGEYRGHFNVKLVHVISAERGADNGTYGVDRDTALGAHYYCRNIERLLCVETEIVYHVAASHAPEYDLIFVIVNDPKYGGAGGTVAVFSVHQVAGEIAEHELGHSLGGLVDEYEEPYPAAGTCPPLPSDCREPNATQIVERDQTKWRIWIAEDTPLPTPPGSGDVVGLFEGCRYQAEGVYRPRESCKMRSLGVPFCEICTEALVRAVYGIVDPVDVTSPASPVTLGVRESVTLEVARPAPEPDTVEVRWTVDGAARSGTASTFLARAEQLGLGTHEIEAEVRDATALVRADPTGLLVSRRRWTVTVTDVDPEHEIPADADADASAETDGELDCVPGERSCGGIYQVLVCRADGAGWEEAELCYADRPCRDGECRTRDDGDDVYCGCGAPAGRPGSLVGLLLLVGLVSRRRATRA